MGEAGGIVALDAQDDRLLRFDQSSRARGTDLKRAGYRSDVENAGPGFVRLAAGVDVFEVSAAWASRASLPATPPA